MSFTAFNRSSKNRLIFVGPSKVRKSQVSANASRHNEFPVKRFKIPTVSPRSTRGTNAWNHLLAIATQSRLLGRVDVEAICVRGREGVEFVSRDTQFPLYRSGGILVCCYSPYGRPWFLIQSWSLHIKRRISNNLTHGRPTRDRKQKLVS